MLRGDWPKGYYRLGCAHMALGQWREAVAAFKGGLHIAPGFNDVSAKLAEAQAKVDREDAARRAAAATARRSLVLKLRAARREDQKLAMLNQFKQSMTAPDWDLEDLEWWVLPPFLVTETPSSISIPSSARNFSRMQAPHLAAFHAPSAPGRD